MNIGCAPMGGTMPTEQRFAAGVDKAI